MINKINLQVDIRQTQNIALDSRERHIEFIHICYWCISEMVYSYDFLVRNVVRGNLNSCICIQQMMRKTMHVALENE